jgi:diguanylate cyclase (GGDEF)-like protein
MHETERRADRAPRRAILPPMPGGAEAGALLAVHAATRGLLTAETPDEVVDLLVALVERLGGRVVPAPEADEDAIPVDLALGVRAPLLATAPDMGVARLNLEALLPGLVQDAGQAVQALRAAARRDEEASVDVLTGVLTRRALFRHLAVLGPGDVVVLLDLDHFKRLNDTQGHDAGDATLRSFGRVLRESVRHDDVAGRYGGEELVLGLRHVDLVTAELRVAELRRTWLETSPAVTFSAGVAPLLTTGGAEAALQEADRALYRAKETGRDRCVVAHHELRSAV